MQKITSSTALRNVHNQLAESGSGRYTDAFNEGHQMGRQCSLEDQAEGYRLNSSDDIWTFLEGEMSPDRRDHDDFIPVEQQAGFIVGYLSTMFASQSSVRAPQPVPTRPGQRDKSGYTLDSSGWPMDL